MEGVVRDPSLFAMTSLPEPDTKATQEFVVPRSIPMTAPIQYPFLATLGFGSQNKQFRIHFYWSPASGSAWASSFLGSRATRTRAGRSILSLIKYPFWRTWRTEFGATEASGSWPMAS
jgi:hypothetical protein